MLLMLAAAVIIAGAVFYTLAVREEDLAPPDPVSPTQHLEQRKASIYENLRDLQFEFRLGKLSEQDYQKTKQDLQGELAAVLAEIDRINAGAAKTPASLPAKGKPAGSAPPAAARFECPHCGAEFEQDLKFCGECGKPMKAASA